MNALYMKIHSYEETSGSLIVSFASDKTASQNPDDYTSYAFQPLNMWPDVTDVEEIKKRIAVAGMYHAEQQAREEAFKVDTDRVSQIQNLVGQLSSYTAAELIANTSQPDVNSVEEV